MSDIISAPEHEAQQVGGSARLLRRIALRLGAAVFVLWGTITVTFLVLAVLPGDRATILLNITSGQVIERTPAELAPINAQYGFDKPIAEQYLHYLSRLLHADLGFSFELQRPVSHIIAEQLLPTFTLAIAALLLAWLIAIPWTLLTAGRHRRLGALGAAVETIMAGLPPYWIGILLLIVFAIDLRWFPVVGGASLWGTVLPAFTLAIPLAGFIGHAIRGEFESRLQQPFVLSARARGMSLAGVRLRHVLRHALIPAITLSGWAIGNLLSGAVLVEAVFARPGLGNVLVNAVSNKDFALVSGIVILISFLYIVINLVVDLISLIIDPRLRGRS
ncbi:ABC transporter permease [Pantoea sp. At-9b]|jgi:peptide/nickel transport system permease protein|uniref:ABC transporter permease n=1 Tax=Pantoea sp. (strain At-9b) TaxID=592316 RepID=UPI0001B3DE35|nr:ABC transporter permease [Pantoea sp. At-9b]ADU72540.1 binding-protein-dependent transport systems inner membrane component [Pantoea sp. At-9b]